MASLPAIYTIRATDALQPAARLQEISQNLKKENRIADFTMLGADKDLSSLTDTIEEEELILILLSNQLELYKEQIENRSQKHWFTVFSRPIGSRRNRRDHCPMVILGSIVL